MCWAIEATLGKFRGMEIEARQDDKLSRLYLPNLPFPRVRHPGSVTANRTETSLAFTPSAS
jgi:hypothetical protein